MCRGKMDRQRDWLDVESRAVESQDVESQGMEIGGEVSLDEEFLDIELKRERVTF